MNERCMSKVNKTESCWLWTAAKQSDGYGTFWKDGKLTVAHRVAWEETFGHIPNGLQVLHKCDVRLCVNPSHLFLGTQADNLQDAVNKGRLDLSACGKRRSLTALRNNKGKFANSVTLKVTKGL